MSDPDQAGTVQRLDATGLLCPLPVIRTQDLIKRLPPNARVEVIADDPGVEADIPAWCRVHGHVLERMDVEGHIYRFAIRVQR
jgi:tRNA 2-thiouridine synthesizing protein A